MKHLLFGLALLLASFSASSQPAMWLTRSAPPFGGRIGMYSFVVNGVAYAGGGDISTGTTSANDL